MTRFDAIEPQSFSDTIGIVSFVEGGRIQHVVHGQGVIHRIELRALTGLARGHPIRTIAQRYAPIKEMSHAHPITAMCEVWRFRAADNQT